MSMMYPRLKEDGWKPVRCYAGIRVVPQRNQLGRTPTASKHSKYDNVWFIGGLGSRGLLYHALLARLVIQAVVEVQSEKEALKAGVMEGKRYQWIESFSDFQISQGSRTLDKNQKRGRVPPVHRTPVDPMRYAK
eukprot:CAMPEP_0119049226 /NCGR_PEP_ID=MMETSP1177-20130426/63485_1 /TAXON_ID=2985 /ORGANISM="Ochromonas sp, Strain CCMP1899" /LENGTH=133 /DNA_ID=CAMNT_0007026173 /DNA_START=202 /DNA_END=604 /DNA_ORIENTATION=-